MSPSIAALLELQAIDHQRQTLRKAREGKHAKVAGAEKTWKAAELAATTAQAEVDKLGALTRQYEQDIARCEAQIAELRGHQAGAKTNKEYMGIINGVEQAKLEKSHREQSVKDLASRTAGLQDAATKAAAAVEIAKAGLGQMSTAAGDLGMTSEEVEVQARYDQVKANVDPAFLEHYERLIKANHKMPLMRIDPKTRATAYGVLISHNHLEQVRMGKLVIDRGSNAILYVDG